MNAPAFHFAPVASISSYGVKQTRFCGCCLSENIPLVASETCLHLKLYFKLFLSKLQSATGMKYICYKCHSVLKKIKEFNDMVLETLEIWKGKVPKKMRKIKINCIQNSKTTHTTLTAIDELDIKTETSETDTNYPLEFELKIENEWETPQYQYDNVDENIPDVAKPDVLDVLDCSKLVDPQSPEHITLDSGDTIPTISKYIMDKTFSIPKLDRPEIKLIWLNLCEVKEELQKRKEKYQSLPFSCLQCGVRFKSENQFKIHMTQHDPTSKQIEVHLICDICRCILHRDHAEKHYVGHFVRFECLNCHQRYDKEDTAYRHAATHAQKENVQCKKCDYVAHSKRNLRYHNEKHHSDQSYNCKLCLRAYSSKSTYNSHVQALHSNVKAPLTKCNICGKLYKHKNSLAAHIRLVHNSTDSEAYCQMCQKYFKSAACFKTHIRMHKNHSQASFTCDHCDKSFNRKGTLRMHIENIHLKPSSCACEYCNKTFAAAKNLQRHINEVHFKIKKPRNFICDICGKGFRTKTILQSHIRTHTGERPFRCTICDATFTQSGALFTHKKLVHKPRDNIK